jgi:hypothetical protein
MMSVKLEPDTTPSSSLKRSRSRHKSSKAKLDRVPESNTELVGRDVYDEIKSELKALRGKASTGAEQEYLDEYLRLFVTNRKIIRLFERKLLTEPTSRDVYALSTLYSQQREIIADIRTLSDLGGQVTLLYQHMLTPFVSGLTQVVTDTYYQLRRLIIETCKKDSEFALKQLDDLTKELGRAIQMEQEKAQMAIQDIMLGPADLHKEKPKKRRSR